MAEYDTAQFWKRYKKLAKKDLPVILKTQIKQSTCTVAAPEIELASDCLNDERKWIILSVAKGLEAQFPKKS
jgi:hypothetical protein